MSISSLVNNVLKNDLKFDGFVISDYDQIQRIKNQQQPSNPNAFDSIKFATQEMFNSGVDMFMLSSKQLLGKYI